MTTNPRITVITPSYNQANFLRETIESVLTQGYANLEFFVIDGASTDNSVEIIREYSDNLDWWVSEPDDGQSDALSKGFKRATGDYFVWLNSDDILLPGALNSVAKTVHERPDVQWMTGHSMWIDADSRIVRCSRLPAYNPFLAKIGFMLVGGPSTFFSRSLYQRVDGLRSELHYNMDTDLWWQFERAGVHYHRIQEYLMAFRVHDGSKTSKSNAMQHTEDDNQAIRFSPFIKRKYDERQKEERDLLLERYGQRLSMWQLAAYLSRCQQTLSGSYVRSYNDLRRIHGLHWLDVFS